MGSTQVIATSSILPARIRYGEVDALRGIAALLVVTFHLLYTQIGIGDGIGYWYYSPFFSGQESVVLFFVLSGFVLALPFFDGPVSVPAFWCRRVCRIWLPYIAAIALFLLAYDPILAPLKPGWLTPPTPALIGAHALLIGSFNTNAWNGVIWSLVHEMRMSLLFPFVMVWWGRQPAWRLLVGGLALSLIGVALNRLTTTWGWPNDYFLTLHYALMFGIGAWIARERQPLIVAWGARPGWQRAMWLMVATILYLHAKVVAEWAGLGAMSQLLHEWPVTLGAAVMLVASLAPGRLQDFLRTGPLVGLGQISYGLYLYHLVVLKYLIYGRSWMAMPFRWLLVLGVSLGMAWVSFHVIERPAMRLGRALAGRFDPGVIRNRAG